MLEIPNEWKEELFVFFPCVILGYLQSLTICVHVCESAAECGSEILLL